MTTGEGFALAREELVRTLTAYRGITTGAGTSGGTSLVCSDISGETYLTRHNKSILIMSGDAQYETVGIASVSGEVVNFTEALSARIVAGVSFRILNTLPGSLHITSGTVQIEGYDYISGEYRLVAVNVSGQIEIKATVADIVTARVSGVVAVVSGEVHVMSGQVDVFMMSGQLIAKVSGQSVVVTSGQVALASGTGPILAKVSGETVELASGTGPILARISGDVVKISGETVIAKVSGEVAKVSGEAVKISGETVELASGTGPILAKISGDVVKISGETVELQSGTGPILAKVSGETVIAKVSGETVSIETPTMVKTGLIQIVTHGSGGQVLYSGAVKSAVVKAVAANSGMIAVGGSGDRPWYEDVCSGQGLVLDGGEAVSLDVDDFDRVYVVAEVSGDQVSFLGVN